MYSELYCLYQYKSVHSLIHILIAVSLQEFALLFAYHPIINITLFQSAQQLQTFIFMRISL